MVSQQAENGENLTVITFGKVVLGTNKNTVTGYEHSVNYPTTHSHSLTTNKSCNTN